MNLKRLAVVVVVAVVLILAAYLVATKTPAPAAVSTPTEEAVAATPAPSPAELPAAATPSVGASDESATPAPTSAPDPSAAAADIPLNEKIPDLQTIREQVAKDPHTTPPAMLAFSVDVAKRMQKVALNEDGAKQVFSELEDCALNDKQKDSNSIQAICLLNAHKLAAKFPSLGGRFDKLSTQADPEAMRRAKALFK